MKISEDELEYRKNKIIHCAFDMFCERGISRFSMRNLAKNADVGITSIFRYFNNKSDLLLKTQQLLWNEILSEILPAMIKENYKQKNGYQQICCLLDGFEHIYKEHKEYLLFACEYKIYLRREGLVLKEDDYNNVIVPVQRVFVEALKKGKDDGSIKIEGKFDDIFYAVWGILRGFMEESVLCSQMLDTNRHLLDQFNIVRKLILSALTIV